MNNGLKKKKKNLTGEELRGEEIIMPCNGAVF